MKPPTVIVFSAVCILLAGCASPTSKQMRTGRDAMKQSWQDAKDGNWEVCAMNLASTLQHMREGVKLQPVRQTKTGEVDLAPYLAAMESGAWSRLQSAVRQHNMAAFRPAYVEAANACITCHTAAGRPKICLRLPEEANSPQ